VETAARHLRLLSDVVAAATATLDLDEVLHRVAGAVADALGADACFVYVLDEPSDDLVLGASVGVLPEQGPTPRMRVGDGITGYAAATRVPLAIARDAHLDPRFKRFSNLDEDAYASILAVPVVARDRLIGALNVRTIEPRAYDDAESELLVTIAAQIGQAIQNARLWGRSQRRIAELEALDRITRTMQSPVDVDEALGEAMRTAATAAHADVCALALAPAPGEDIAIAYRSGTDGPSDDALRSAAVDAPYEAAGLIALPLVTRRGSLGALVCARSARTPFTRAERALLGSVATQAAASVAEARGTMRGLLVQEIHHRVKNNLQTVASLLRLAGSGDSDPRRALRDSVSRVLSIAEVHDLLTRTRGDDVDSADLLRRLTEMLRQTLGGSVTVTLAPIIVSPARATALALVYCELFSNALEHGGGSVEVTLRRDGAFGELAVRDEGPGGLPRIGESRGQGLAIARALIESDLAGSLAFEDAEPGVRARVRFPLAADGPVKEVA
jgi:two-component sensor histidine kinase/putative methionine-R-sulfoxide reductase with GAF domain